MEYTYFHEQQQLLKLLEERLRLSRLQRFGANSEKLFFQLDFFDEAKLEVALSDPEAQLPEGHLPKKPCKKRHVAPGPVRAVIV